MKIQYKGTRWFKCDLHLHTPASKCFQDQNVTPLQWVQRAIDQGLNCVAVTDHNTGDMVDAIKAAAVGTGLTVFPGVEITCDTSKVHLLVLFDVNKTTTNVNDFLISCGVSREMFADQLAGTTKTIFEVSEIANNQGAIVIPAHIDEFNGLEKISNENLKSFFDLSYINAVQVIHKEFLNPKLVTNNNNAFRSYLNDYYNNPPLQIDFARIADWHRPVRLALSKEIAITTFSDNTHEPKNSRHGLDGIGSRYTWIKMDEIPTLEGLRQAFLLPEYRVKNDFVSNHPPYAIPVLWIKSITISNTAIIDSSKPLRIDFSPQLTTIIGGRGSGKSSVLRFLRGLFNRPFDLIGLNEIIADQNDFYKPLENRSKKGVLLADSSVEVEFVRNNILHKISTSNINSSSIQDRLIQKIDSVSGAWELIDADSYIDFFQFEQYSQKQIYEIAKEPNSLRERIDKAVPKIEVLKNEREIIRKSFLQKSASIREIQSQIANKGRLQTEIKDVEDRIKLFHQSGIASLLISKGKYNAQQLIVKSFFEEIKTRESSLDTLISSIELGDVNYESFSDEHSSELKLISKSVVDGYLQIKLDLEKLRDNILVIKSTFKDAIPLTSWMKDSNITDVDFQAKKIELEQKGINDISNFQKLSQEKNNKSDELERILAIEARLGGEHKYRVNLQLEYLAKTKEITTERKLFVTSLLQDERVKVSINPFKNRTDFINKFRTIIQKPNSFDTDIDKLVEECFSGSIEDGLKSIKEKVLKIRNYESVTGITGYFVNLVTSLPDAQIDEIELLFPEDEIDIEYKPSGSRTFKPLSTASAGQKTTAILTFILSQGDIPLILDQPEDDLDNRLVYELIVDRLKQAKEYRQIIVVTHNANIPVNGDAEYIVSMNSESKFLEVIHSGSVEQSAIKKEICDVMEGSKQAFEMRSKRYLQINENK